MNEEQIIICLAVFGLGIYLSYRRGQMQGYTDGYQDACIDVANGDITVKLMDGEE